MSSDLSHARSNRSINGNPVEIELPRPRPERIVHEGRRVTVEPLDPEKHAAELYPLLHGDVVAERHRNGVECPTHLRIDTAFSSSCFSSLLR
jgi:hypothetical protein